MSAAPQNRQFWPMKWVVLAILVVIGPFTYLTLHFRRPGPAFLPYEDMQKRANVARLLSAGYQRVPLRAEYPGDPMQKFTSALIGPAPGGLPDDLRSTLVQLPSLPTEITNAAADPEVDALQPYSIRFTCTLPDQKRQLGGADLYLRDDIIVITPDYEKLSDELLNRSRQSVIQLTIPPGVLKPGRYHITIAGSQASRSWPLQVH